MKIAVIGGGSIGLLTAACLYEGAEHEVSIYTRTDGQAEELNRRGLTLLKGSFERLLPAKARRAGKELPDADLLIIAVKQYHLEELEEWLAASGAAKLFLQNGCGHISLMERLPSGSIYAGVAEFGALRINGHTVRHTGEGKVRIAPVREETGGYPLFNAFEQKYPVKIETDYKKMLFDKLIINAVINPLTAILKVENGALAAEPHCRRTAELYYKEAADILDVGNREEELERIFEVCRKTARNRSSMLSDLDHGRPTEIDAITGYLLEKAAEEGKPHQMTGMLYEMIKALEKAGD